jgi:hypothetical protein
MDAIEYNEWRTWMRSRAGRWTICPIHNGVDRDLIAFIPNRDDASTGVYITASNNTIWYGSYEGGEAHIGDALFFWEWGVSIVPEHPGPRMYGSVGSRPSEAVIKFICEHLGAPFILACAGY